MNLFVFVLVFIGLDIATGLCKAFYREGLNSTCLRKGFIHKFTELLSCLTSLIIDMITGQYIYINFDIPIYNVVCWYIVGMEIVSIIENICEVNPRLRSVFSPYLKKFKGEHEDDKRD